MVFQARGRLVTAVAGLLAASVLGALVPACRGKAVDPAPAPAPSASAAPFGLSGDQSTQVLARVGDGTITLGDYAAVLDGMDRFERLRYQTADRRKQLLDEIINVELLAREAERRGLGDKPETRETIRQILRDEVVRELREAQPPPEELPAAEVRAYYEQHRAEFREPERRRISVIVVTDRGKAEQVLAAARGATPEQWGELVKQHAKGRSAGEAPTELAGDVGFVVAPDQGKNDNPRVTEAVRAAAFEIAEVGGVLPRVVEADRAFHLIRLTARNPPRDRSLEEADRTIRVKLLQERLRATEAALEKQLRERHPVQIDEAALAKVSLPAAPPSGKPK